jgi:hypothetical protein
VKILDALQRAFAIFGTQIIAQKAGALSRITQVIPNNLIHIKDFCVAENYSPKVIVSNPFGRAFWKAV